MKNVFNKKSNGKTILVLAECQQGALKAGRYALKHLYDFQTRIILLQTYKAPKIGISMVRNLASILKNISKEDLTVLKNTLIEEFGIPSDHIVKLAREGDLTSIAQEELKNCDNFSVVIGTDCAPLYTRKPYKRIKSFITITGIRPIFIVDDNITQINQSKILVIQGNKDKMSETFKDFLAKVSEEDKIPVEYSTGDKLNTASHSEGDTCSLFKEAME